MNKFIKYFIITSIVQLNAMTTSQVIKNSLNSSFKEFTKNSLLDIGRNLIMDLIYPGVLSSKFSNTRIKMLKILELENERAKLQQTDSLNKFFGIYSNEPSVKIKEIDKQLEYYENNTPSFTTKEMALEEIKKIYQIY